MPPPHLVPLKCCIFIDVLPTSRCPGSPLCCSCWVADAPAVAQEFIKNMSLTTEHAAMATQRVQGRHCQSKPKDKRRFRRKQMCQILLCS